jgi:hypothetical protein
VAEADERVDRPLYRDRHRALATSVPVPIVPRRSPPTSVTSEAANLLIPVAMGALYPLLHVLLSPMLAAAAMAMSSVSVVSNALRLRAFQRPASAESILRPAWSERVGEYSYLGGVGLVAGLVGVAALWLARASLLGGH